MNRLRLIAFDLLISGVLLIAVALLCSCASVAPAIKTCGTNQYWPPGDEMALAEQIAPYAPGQPIRNAVEDWERSRCENKACQVGYDYCKIHGGPQ